MCTMGAGCCLSLHKGQVCKEKGGGRMGGVRGAAAAAACGEGWGAYILSVKMSRAGILSVQTNTKTLP